MWSEHFATIASPLRNESLQDLMTAAWKTLGNTFISSFLTTVRAIFAFHCEYILQLQDEFPIFLCYSAQSETGTLLLYPIHYC